MEMGEEEPTVLFKIWNGSHLSDVDGFQDL